MSVCGKGSKDDCRGAAVEIPLARRPGSQHGVLEPEEPRKPTVRVRQPIPSSKVWGWHLVSLVSLVSVAGRLALCIPCHAISWKFTSEQRSAVLAAKHQAAGEGGRGQGGGPAAVTQSNLRDCEFLFCSCSRVGELGSPQTA